MKKTQQGFGTITAIIIVVLLVIIGLWVVGDKNPGETLRDGAENTQEAIEGGFDASLDAGEATIDAAAQAENDTGEATGEALQGVADGEQAVSGGTYTDYQEGVLAQGPETQVLFFHASWCPSCRTLEKNILDEGQLPSGVAIYKIDYDSSSDLKAKYGVRTQHTLVQVDSEGNMIKKWSGGNNTASILNKIEA